MDVSKVSKRSIKRLKWSCVLAGIILVQLLSLLIFGQAALPFFRVMQAAFWATFILIMTGLLD